MNQNDNIEKTFNTNENFQVDTNHNMDDVASDTETEKLDKDNNKAKNNNN